jgi:hypothetical protein
VLLELSVTLDIVNVDEEDPEIAVELFLKTDRVSEAVVEESDKAVELFAKHVLSIDRFDTEVALTPLSAYWIFA